MPPLKIQAETDIITPWCDIIAVLSAVSTRTGPWGVPAPCGLPAIMFPLPIVPAPAWNCKDYPETFAEKKIMFF